MLQDTEFLGGGRGQDKTQAGDQTEAFQIYEDTNFLGVPALECGAPPPNIEKEGPDRHTSREDLEPWKLPAVDQENSASGVILFGS